MIAQPPNPGTNAVVREFEEHLSRIRSDAKGDLEQERQTLYLLALEREELATIGYGGDSIQARILKLKAPDAVRALVGHALRWAARDERTHAVLARGLLLSRRKRLLALEAFVTNFAGLIAGWASAVLQHTSFRRAPLSTVAAFFIAQSGRLLGKVPKTAAGTLQTQRFLEFCRFQADAEETAALSWERIAILSEDDGASPDGAAVTIARRIALDERKHRQLFQVFLESFDADDGLVAGIDADGLTARLISIDPSFVGSTR